MVRVARIVQVGGDEIAVVTHRAGGVFMPTRVGQYFVRFLSWRDVRDVLEERALECGIVLSLRAPSEGR
jgi:hypothetical protein